MRSLAIAAIPAHHTFMSEEMNDAEEAKLLGLAIAALRARTPFNQAEAGHRFKDDPDDNDAPGISGQAWGLYETGRARPAIFRPDIQNKIARALGVEKELILTERDRIRSRSGGIIQSTSASRVIRPTEWEQPRSPAFVALALRDRVQAGAWLLADDGHQQVEPAPSAIGRDPRFPNAHQWLSEVVGDSMNLLNIMPGDLIHCVDAVEIGYYPKTGDVVEVERLRFDGAERELTLKQVEITPDGPMLWPRSTNPRYQNPLDLRDGAEADPTLEVRIRGLVLKTIRQF